ncbi:hypothetical protein J19TS2_37960 [Cohnella xylanilytica]|nr:hypothetical protein J19TS2_37960 [Cohnella xylanilytica]
MGAGVNAYVWAAVTALLGIALWTDIRKREIPNVLTAAFAVGGLVYNGAASGLAGLGQAALGAAAGMLPLLVMYMLRGIGGGDVKWFAAFGAWSGAASAWQLVVYSILCAGGIAVMLLLLRLPALRRSRIAGRIARRGAASSSSPSPPPGRLRGSATFPFMVAVAPAYVLLALQG